MAEGEAKSRGVSWSPGVSFLIVTDTARGDVPSLGLGVGGVTFIALVVRRKSVGNRQPHPAPQRRAMTGRATTLWPSSAGQVLSVIELQVEALLESVGKCFQRRIISIDVHMADGTHRHIGRGEL